MKVLAFCLFGDNPLYTEGMRANAALAAVYYPGWEVHLWTDTAWRTEPEPFAVTVHPPPDGVRDPRAWRFAAADLPGITRVAFRDADSRPSLREILAVNDWETSGLTYHAMRDHPLHTRPIQAGMWGLTAQAGMAGRMMDTFRTWEAASRRSCPRDEIFLEEVVWPLARQQGVIQHDPFRHHPGSAPFPGPVTVPFVGEKVAPDGKPHHPFPRQHRAEKLGLAEA